METMNTPVIEIEDLCVEYGRSARRKVRAVDGLNLQVNEGEVVGFVGPNGAGKTTTIKTLMGFLEPTGGTARVFGEPVGTVGSRRRIGYLPEVALYYPFLTAREALGLYAKLAEVPKAERDGAVRGLVERVGLAGRDKERLSGYSKGMLQRVGIAQAIMGDPDLLILDEVTSGLDPVARQDVRGILMEFKSRGKTVFFSSHELPEVALLCDRVVLIDEGKVVEVSDLATLLRTGRRIVVKAEADTGATALPRGVVLRAVADGVATYVVESEPVAQEFRGQLEAAGRRVLETFEEPLSLEDYFVHTLGHKIT